MQATERQEEEIHSRLFKPLRRPIEQTQRRTKEVAKETATTMVYMSG